jgi:hypothetical protein
LLLLWCSFCASDDAFNLHQVSRLRCFIN